VRREYKGMEAPWFMYKKEGEAGAGVFKVQEEIGAGGCGTWEGGEGLALPRGGEAEAD